MTWTGSVVTTKGKLLHAKIEAGAKLELTRLKLGSGNLAADQMENATDLINPKYTLGISSKTIDGNVCKIEGVIASHNVTEGFLVKELGLYAKDPDDGEILYMVAINTNPDFMPANTAPTVASINYILNISFSNANNILVQIDPNGLVTTRMLSAHQSKAELDHPDGSVTGDKIADGAVTKDKIADGAITADKINNNVNDIFAKKDGSNATGTWDIVAKIATEHGGSFWGRKNNISTRTTIEKPPIVVANGDKLEHIPWDDIESIMHAKQTRSGTFNWNTLITDRAYIINEAIMTATNNAPVGIYGYGLLVIDKSKEGVDSAYRVVQTYYPHRATDGVYTRVYMGGAWSAWVPVAGGIVASSLTPNGYVKFANGLLVQWGNVTVEGGSGRLLVQYNLTFNNALCIYISESSYSSRATQAAWSGQDQSSFWLYYQNNVGSNRYFWLAIGI